VIEYNFQGVNVWIKGINRGYVQYHKNGNYCLFNQSHQLLFLFCWNGHSNVIVMGEDGSSKSPPIGEMRTSLTGAHRLTIGKNLPANLKAMILGAHIVIVRINCPYSINPFNTQTLKLKLHFYRCIKVFPLRIHVALRCHYGPGFLF